MYMTYSHLSKIGIKYWTLLVEISKMNIKWFFWNVQRINIMKKNSMKALSKWISSFSSL